MSRAVAGVRNKSVILTLPGSPKGARENLWGILKTLPHACLQAAGVDSRTLHKGGVKKLEEEAGIKPSRRPHSQSAGESGHHHYHHQGHGSLVRHTKNDASTNPLSNDPSLGATRRHRKSPYSIVSVAEALSLIESHTPPPETILAKVGTDLVGAVLAEDVRAAENVPAFRASIVDGYAAVVPEGGDMRGTYPVVSVSHAAPGKETTELKQGELVRITTGAPLPPGATSVIMVEDTLLREMTEDGQEEKMVEILAQGVKEGVNVREVGSDVAVGDVILRKGDIVSAVGGELGILSSVGVAQVKVYRRPIIGILSTGDELVEADTPASQLRYGQVRDTNRPALLAAARSAGYEAHDMGIAADKAEKLEETLRDALRRVDVLITSGGVSMGELDLLKPTVERRLGGTIHFGRVAMKPGKPTTFATVPVKDMVVSSDTASSSSSCSTRRSNRLIFSLPGNPASALVTFQLFVLPSLHRFGGVDPPGRTCIPVMLGHDFPLDNERREYHRAVLSIPDNGGGGNGDGGQEGEGKEQGEGRTTMTTMMMVATSTGRQRSSIVGSMRKANALLEMPAQKELKDGQKELKKGTVVGALIVGGL